MNAQDRHFKTPKPLKKTITYIKSVKVSYKLAWHHRILISLVTLFYLNLGYWFVAWLPKNNLIHAGTFLDRLMPIFPFFVLFYLIGDIFFFLPFFIVEKEKAFTKMAFTYLFMITISFLLFALLPIPMYKQPPTGNDIFSQITLIQQGADTNFNNFPSLHVSLNLFALLMLREHNQKLSYYFLPLVALIIASTLLIQQHLIIDVLGGIALASLAYFFYVKWNGPNLSA